jgi:hypothetical protein
MLRSTALMLLLCACAARPSDDDPEETETDDEATNDETTAASASGGSLDDSSGPGTTVGTTAGTTVGTTVGTTATVTTTTGDPMPSFDAEIQPILDEHCVMACHEPDGEWGFLLDMSGSAYEAIVGVPSPQFWDMSIIEPGEPNASYLWHKISGTQASIGGSGLMMPKPRAGMQATVLTAEQLATIEQWILAGAPP